MDTSFRLPCMFSILGCCLGLSLHLLSNAGNYEDRYFKYSIGKRDLQPSEMVLSSHIFLRPDFWAQFFREVEVKKSWKCEFPGNILTKTLEQDATLYSNENDKTIFRNRRFTVDKWVKNDSAWVKIVLGACKEIASGEEGVHSQQLKELKLYEALKDFVDHLDFFYKVALLMNSRGEEVLVLRDSASSVHDIDKLDPVMLVAYSERFEDNKTTSVWNTCVDDHTRNNPHHQQSCLWHECDTDSKCMNQYMNARTIAVREMVCDKVSRRVQKNLNGQFTEEMWDVEIEFYKGLPLPWLKQVTDLMKRMKNSGRIR